MFKIKSGQVNFLFKLKSVISCSKVLKSVILFTNSLDVRVELSAAKHERTYARAAFLVTEVLIDINKFASLLFLIIIVKV